MNINDDRKIEILLSALAERYASIHRIRDRVQNVCLWALGILLTASGWLLQADIHFSRQQQVIAILGTIIAFVALRFFYLADLNKGFRTQQIVMVRLETSLGFFTAGFFGNTDKSMLPETWERSGTEEGAGKFFASSHLLLYVGVVLFIGVIVMTGSVN